MKKNRILLVGSLPPPFHGQSIAFDMANKAVSKHTTKVIETSFRGKKSLFQFITYLCLIPFHIIFFKPKKVYFLCSRSLVGSLRDLYLLVWCKLFRVDVYNHLHGSDFEGFISSLPSIYKKLLIFFYKDIKMHAVLINGMQEQFKKICPSFNIKVIPNFYSEKMKLKEPPHTYQLDNELKIVYLSSIMPSKGIFELLEAVSILTQKGANISLKIAGGFVNDGVGNSRTTKEKFQSFIDKYKNIKYVGVLNEIEKTTFLAESHVLALPSYYKSEAVPLAIIEAMAMQNTIITTAYKYLPQLVVNNENGILVPPKNIEKIVDAISILLSNPDMQNNIAKHNQQQAEHLYSQAAYCSNIKKFIGVE